jgi:hypothetical protein
MFIGWECIMKVCVVRACQLNYFLEKIKPSLEEVDLVLLSYQTTKCISYEKEVTGETNTIKTILQASKDLNCLILLGCYFELLGEKTASVLVCEKGELLGIVDAMPQKGTSKHKTKHLKLFVTKLGSVGVLAANDLLNDKLRQLTLKFEPRILINIVDEVEIKTWNESLQQKLTSDNEVVFSLSSHTFFYKQPNEPVKLNFCEFFTKDFKI